MLYSTLFFQQSLPLSFLFQTLQLPFYYSLMINLNPFKDIECKSPNRRLIFPFIMTQLLVILALVGAVLCANSCQAHIANLTKLFVLNRPQFIKQVHGYVIYSGKMINDLGFPDACHKYPNYRYFTGEVHGEGEFFQHRGYLGVCFSKECNQTDINQNAALIVNTLLNISIVTNTTSMNFTEPSLEVQTTAGEIVFLALFLLLVACSLKESVFSFFKNCKKQAKKEDEELYGKYAIQFGDDYDPNLLIIHQNQGFFKKYCLPSKMHEYLSAEQSSKIVAFSAIRILAVPLALYGYLFYLANIGSYNYNAFAGEIYSQSYSKIAVSAYYIPDILFFISGFLLAKKAFMLIEVEPRAGRALIKLFYQKVFKWLPIYWAAILIYWQITPALHAGPVWYEYQSQAAVCNSKWWQSLLFIDNWFQNGCYNFAWYIPAQIQLSLLGILLLWIYQKNQKVGFSLLIALFLATWIITLTISAPFPTSLDSTLSSNTITYFKSTYSHMPYYLLGIINGYLGHHQKMKEIMQKLTRNKIFRVFGVTIGMVIMSVIVIRPSVWQKQLNFELGLAKTGMFLALYLLIFWSMFGGKTKTTVIHRIATLSKGVMLIGGIVVASFYWGGFSFPYLDQNYLLRTTITNLTIAIPVGALFIAMFSPKPKKEEQPIL